MNSLQSKKKLLFRAHSFIGRIQSSARPFRIDSEKNCGEFEFDFGGREKWEKCKPGFRFCGNDDDNVVAVGKMSQMKSPIRLKTLFVLRLISNKNFQKLEKEFS